MTEQVENTVSSTLQFAMTAGQTTATVISGAIFPASGDFRLRVDDEIMKATSRASNVITVTRASEGTTGVAHDAGATVKMVHSAEALETIIDERVAASAAAVARGASVKADFVSVPASTWVNFNFETLLYRTAPTIWDSAAGGRLIPDKDGLWLVTYTWWWSANVNGERYHRIYVNGSLANGETDWLGMRTDNPLPYNSRSRVLDLNASDYVQLQLQQTTSGALNVNYALAELTYLGSR